MGDKHGQPKKIEDFSKVISTFSSHYNDKYDDQISVTEEERKKRQETAPQIADSYYDFASTAYEANWSTHFHYTPFPPSYPPGDSTLATAMLFYEHRLAHLMRLRPGMKVLDVGCGIGGPARSIAKFIGCEVVGLSINQGQIDRAIFLTKMEGLQGQCTFVGGDFLDMPFKDGAFDAVYAIEATVHSPSLLKVYREIARVLKPGAPFGLSEWVMTPKFDPSDQKHIGIRNRLERGNGLVNLHTRDQAREAFVGAGFQIDYEEDFARHFDYAKQLVEAPGAEPAPTTEAGNTRDNPQSPVLVPFSDGLRPAPPSSLPPPSPSSHPALNLPLLDLSLQGHHHLATTWTDYWTAWKMSTLARRLCYWWVWIGERIGFVDKGVMEGMMTMAFCVDSAVEGGLTGVFSPCWWFIGRKVGHADTSGNGKKAAPVVGSRDANQERKVEEDLSVLMH